jgi:multiple sugar transport system substrate-binding protein
MNSMRRGKARGHPWPLLTARSALMASACALALTSGCAPTAPGTQWPTDSEPGKTITILSGADTSVSPGDSPVESGESGMYQQLVDYWNSNLASQAGFTVQLDVVSGGATSEHSEMLAAAQTGDTSYDIYNLDNEWVSEFADSGYIRSVQGRVAESGFLPEPLRSGEDAAGHLDAVPFTTDVGLLYYRSDLVSAVQVRELHSFDDLVSRARKVMQRPGSGVSEGYAGQFATYEGLTVNALEVIWGHDRAAFDSDGKIRNSKAVTTGLQDLVDAFTPSRSAPPVAAPQETSYQEAQALADFATGKAVFMRNWPIDYSQLAAATPIAGEPATSYVAAHFGVAPLPFPSALGGQDLAIATGSPDPNEALQVISFLTSPSAERCLFAVGGFPATRQSAYAPGGSLTSSEYPDLCGRQPGRSVQIGPVILAALRTAIPRPTARYYSEFSTQLQDRVSAMLAAAAKGDEPYGAVATAVSTLVADLDAAADGRAPPPGG